MTFAPRALCLGHLINELFGNICVPSSRAAPFGDGCREPSPATTGLGPAGYHPSALQPSWSARSACRAIRLTFLLGHWLPLPHTAEHPIKDEAGQMGWLFWKDKRPEWVQAEEREFIKAANRLKTLQVTPRGGMRIDPEELRDQILEARELYKELVQK